MLAHPLIGFRAGEGGREPYVLGTGLAVWELIELVGTQGSMEGAARLARIDSEFVEAAVRYYNELGAGAVALPQPAEKPERVGALQLVTQAFGLFAGLATIIYIAGGVVLALRLAFERVPWEPVVAQLPREFVLSTGAGQVLLPALIVGGLYGLYRLLRGERPSAPQLSRWRDGSCVRLGVMLRYLVIAALLLVPGAVVAVVREVFGIGRDPELVLLFAGYGVMLLPAIALHELRAVMARHYSARWNRISTAALVAGIYVVAAVPAMMAAGSALPLTDAKVCATDDFEEHGVLVGQTADRVYLGEPREEDRRLAVFPLSQVEELFIGTGAEEADCDFGDATMATEASE